MVGQWLAELSVVLWTMVGRAVGVICRRGRGVDVYKE
jgi:hypothetical protein